MFRTFFEKTKVFAAFNSECSVFIWLQKNGPNREESAFAAACVCYVRVSFFSLLGVVCYKGSSEQVTLVFTLIHPRLSLVSRSSIVSHTSTREDVGIAALVPICKGLSSCYSRNSCEASTPVI